MASWKTRNEVPDSDDEGEGIDSQLGESEAITGSWVANVVPSGVALKAAAPDHSEESEDELALPGPQVRAIARPSPKEDRCNSPDPVEETYDIPGEATSLDQGAKESKDPSGASRWDTTEGDANRSAQTDGLHLTNVSRSQSSPLSSPLSELSSSPPPAWSLIDGHTAQLSSNRDASRDVEAHNVALTNDDAQLVAELEALEDQRNPQRRSKRKRNAIQLHPYLIENQLYRQAIQHTGIAPVRFVEPETRSDPSDEYESEPEAWDTQDIDPTFNRPVSRERPSGNDSTLLDVPEDDEPANLEQLLGLPVDNDSQVLREIGHRVNGQVYSRKRKRKSVPQKIASLEPTLRSTTAEAAAHLMLSPPTSSPRDTRTKSPKRFRFPPDITPPQLHTPAVSSAARPHSDLIARSETNPDEKATLPLISSLESHGHHAIVETLSDDDNTLSESSVDDVQAVRRRIKGVLPASWLRIDQKKQSHAANSRPKIGSDSPPRSAHRGVARPLPKRRKESVPFGQMASTMNLASDDDSPEMMSEKQQTIGSAHVLDSTQGGNVLHSTIDVDSDSMEDNFVDPMLPTQRRRRRNGFINETKPSHRRASSKIHRRQTRLEEAHFRTRRITHAKKIAHEVPLLSIADYVEKDETRKPDFLRIALRTTKFRRDGGRQSPYHKVVQLGSSGSSDESQEVLSEWRARSLPCFEKPSVLRKSARVSTRSPQAVVSLAPMRDVQPRPIRFTQESSRIDSGLYRRTYFRQETLEQVLDRQAPKDDRVFRQKDSTQEPFMPTSRSSRRTVTFNISNQDPLLPAQLENEHIQPRLVNSRDFVDASRWAQHAPASDSISASHRLSGSGEGGRRHDAITVQDPGLGASDARNRPLRLRKRHPIRRLIRPSTLPSRYLTRDEPELPNDPLCEKLDISHKNYVGQLCLRGLGSHGTSYSHDFDVEHFPIGTQINVASVVPYNSATQIFETLSTRDMMRENVSPTDRINSHVCQWNQWNEDVSSACSGIFQDLRDVLESRANHFLLNKLSDQVRDVIVYFSERLWFLDVPDRATCLEEMSSRLDILAAVFQSQKVADNPDLVSMGSRVLILSYQLVQIAEDESVSYELKRKTLGVTQKWLQISVISVFDDGISDFYKYQQATANCSEDWAGQQSKSKVAAFVIAHRVCQKLSLDIWRLLRSTKPFELSAEIRDVTILEQRWFNLFILLPFLNANFQEEAASARDFVSSQCWSFVLDLLAPIFDAYKKSEINLERLLNEYFRATLGRCNILVRRWHWVDSEIVVRSVYDFFARRNLQNLPFEDRHEYPSFLTDFKASKLTFEKRDSAFQLFLKFLGSSLYHTKKTEKQLRSIVFRLTPNHSRSIPKEQELRREDLDALQNHHNLLCLFYLVLPPQCRPRLGLLQDLIRLEDSHRQACHVSVRTWSDIVGFQLSTQESLSTLKLLIGWYDDVLDQLIRQHKLAQREVESHDGIMSSELRKAMISANQRQVEAVLVDALFSLRQLLPKAQNCETSNLLLTPNFKQVLQLFNANVPRTNTVVLECLEVVSDFTNHQDVLKNNSESQDFGDWTVFDEYLPTGLQGSSCISEEICQSLHMLLSNCLGANSIVEERLVVKTITTWIAVASHRVTAGVCQWSEFVDPYGKESWYKLRQTNQTAKYAPLFLSLVVENDRACYQSHQALIMRSWISSLVERESQLKYQARLTSAILNCDSANPLFENLPFHRERDDNRYRISATEFSSRRVSLLSTLLSNMAESLLFAAYHDLEHSSLRHEYADLLKTLMKAIKDQYLALDTGSGIYGAYIGFAQSVAGFLQQYTNHIQPIDRFFTDAKNFPLPVHDPEYIVCRLKSYRGKSSTDQGAKQLVAFVQSIVERSVLDGQQKYLTSQLESALQDGLTSSSTSHPTLCAFVIDYVVPSYVEAAARTEIGRLLAEPLLQALPTTLKSLIYTIDGAKRSCVSFARAKVEHLLQCFEVTIHKITVAPEQLARPATIRFLTCTFATIAAVLRPLDYWLQLQPPAWAKNITLVKAFCASGYQIFSYLNGSGAALVSKSIARTWAASSTDASTFNYASTSLQNTINKWQLRDLDGGGYELTGPGARRALRNDLGTLAEEREKFRGALMTFMNEVEHLPSFAMLCTS